MEQRISEFSRLRARLIEVLNQYPSEAADKVLFDDWSLKSVVSHLAGWDRYFTDILKDLEAGKEAPYWGSIKKFNEGSVGKRKDLRWEEVYDEFISASDDFIREYSQVSLEVIDKKFWPNRSYTPTDIVDINIHHYGISHLPVLERGIKRLERR